MPGRRNILVFYKFIPSVHNFAVHIQDNLVMPSLTQGIDGSARKPVVVQDTGCIVEKTYLLASYLGTYRSYFMPHMVQKVFPYTKIIVGKWRLTHVIFHLVKKPLVWVKTTPTDYMVEETYHLA